MAKTGQMNIDEKETIIAMYLDGDTINKIATTIDRNFRTVSKFLNKQEDNDFEEYKEFIEKYKEKKEERQYKILDEVDDLKKQNVSVAKKALSELENRLDKDITQFDIYSLIKIAGIATDKILKMLEIESDKGDNTKVIIVNDLPNVD